MKRIWFCLAWLTLVLWTVSIVRREVHAQAPLTPVVNLVTLTPVVDVFHGVLAQNGYTLSKQPAGNVMVFLNGLLQVAPDDYTLSGTSLTFVLTVDTPIVQVLYWAQ